MGWVTGKGQRVRLVIDRRSQNGGRYRRIVLELPSGGDTCLVFLPGFMADPAAYRALLVPLTSSRITVVVPQVYPRGPRALLGGVPPHTEAAAACDVVRQVARRPWLRRVFLGGHSRGGMAAAIAAEMLHGTDVPVGLVLVDPVDGAGPRPSTKRVTAQALGFQGPALVIGAGIGGRCAPAPVNHDAFAAALPQAGHVVVSGLGHADVLDGRAASRGKRLCGGADAPEVVRGHVTALLGAFVDDPVALKGLPEALRPGAAVAGSGPAGGPAGSAGRVTTARADPDPVRWLRVPA